MRISEEDFSRACGDVVALVTEHGDGPDGEHCGFHGQLAAIGLDPTSTIDVAEHVASGATSAPDGLTEREGLGLAFITGMLVGIQLGRGEGE